MSTPGSRFLYALSATTLVAAALYGLTTGGSALGVVSLGYKGGVGEHLGYTILVSVAVLSGLLGGVLSAVRDADPAAVLEVVEGDRLPDVAPAQGGSWWPLLTAFGAALVAVGLVAGATLFGIGLVVLAIALVEWGVKAWSEQATADPEANRALRDRLMQPFEIPAIAVLGIAFVVVALSRVLLAAPKLGATIGAMVLAGLVLAVAVVIALRPTISRGLVTGLLVLGGVAVLAGGVTAAVVGERDIEEHSEHHGEEHSEDGDHGGGAESEGASEEGEGG